MSNHLTFEPFMNAAGWYPVRPVREFCLGVDLGQSFDPTAICLLEHRREGLKPPEGIGVDLRQKLGPSEFVVKHLQRVPLGTSYPAIAQIVAGLLAKDEIRGNCSLVIDRTGVGRAVGDIFTRAGLPHVGVTITGGEGERCAPDGNGFRVSKLALVSRLQAEFHSKSLRIPKNLKEAPALVTELQNFRASFSEAGNLAFGARSGQHDDIVLSLALALWYLGDRGSGWKVEEVGL